jgi:hypothetical protein
MGVKLFLILETGRMIGISHLKIHDDDRIEVCQFELLEAEEKGE